MRILGGSLKGREIVRPKTAQVRPIAGLTREALFAILGPLDGKQVLDAYAGSGAIGFEALSRGAGYVEAVEKLPEAAASIRRNASHLGAGSRHRLARMPLEAWLKKNQTKFHVIVAGPPFDSLDVNILNSLAGHLSLNGVLVVWHSSRIASPELKSVQLVSSRKYGDSSLSFYALQ
jgi:16S rRNA (guanine966-N2)-methyltransferase